MVDASMGTSGKFELRSESLGPLPVINHFCDLLGVGELLDSWRRPPAAARPGDIDRSRDPQSDRAPRTGLRAW